LRAPHWIVIEQPSTYSDDPGREALTAQPVTRGRPGCAGANGETGPSDARLSGAMEVHAMAGASTTVASEPASRRRLLRLVGAGAAALVAALLPGDVIRAGHGDNAPDPDALHLGHDNFTTAPTTLSAEIPTEPDPDPRALSVFIPQGRAIHGNSQLGVGVWGHSEHGDQPGNPPVGVEGTAHNDGIGVRGQSKAGDGEGPGAGAGVIGESGSGPGIEGNSDSGPGVAGHSNGSEPGVRGSSESGPGLEGHASGERGGVEGHGQDGPGGAFDSVNASGVTAVSGGTAAAVAGFSETGKGGSFSSHDGIGVRGFIQSDSGVSGPGVLGAAPGDPPGVRALSAAFVDGDFTPDSGLALEVIGKASFSTAGAATVPHGDNSVFVANSAATPDSHISITLVTDPGPRQLRWIERSDGGFTVLFAGGPPGQRPATDFTYLIVEPVAS